MTTNSSTPKPDVTYSTRHLRRNQRRVQAIVANYIPSTTALDIGCNEGYVSQSLLDRNLIAEVDAVELDSAIVLDRLKQDARFSLEIIDIIDFEFKKLYDCTIYGAVHHHVFGNHGYCEALNLWTRIIEHTDKFIFFETGQLPEGARWYWQRALRHYYGGDEGYFADLLWAVGPRLKDVRVVGTTWIHGVRRWLLRIELFRKAEMADDTLGSETLQESVNVIQQWNRSIGARKQGLIKQDISQTQDRHEGVTYYESILEGNSKKKVFCKKHASRHKMRHEITIAQQIDSLYFIRPYAYTERYGIVYPFFDMQKLDEINKSELGDRHRFSDQVRALFSYAEKKYVKVDVFGGVLVPLIEVIDIHASNILYDESEQALRVVDLELYCLGNRRRNQWHMTKLLLRFAPHNTRTVLLCLYGVVVYGGALLRNCWKAPVTRILQRTPCLAIWLYMKLRESVYYGVARMRCVPRLRG